MKDLVFVLNNSFKIVLDLNSDCCSIMSAVQLKNAVFTLCLETLNYNMMVRTV